ncbi:CheR family methyltransferase [Chelativorans alearense]|uniref:CheR family methyltransferase n=1 Tax=Chelativorans alearense TaxID=2681495 RepID=UPI001FE3A728|nr:CheR family methyltransferase [Chelativorans alearense]
MNWVGRLIYRKYTRGSMLIQSHYTKFLRNPPLLEVLADSMSAIPQGSVVKLSSIGCSTGAELYSALYVLREARPDLRILACGADISAAAVEVAKKGIYRSDIPAVQDSLYEAGRPEVTKEEIEVLGGILQRQPNGMFLVRDRLREGIRWIVADACDGQLTEELGPQDVVMANNVLGAMPDAVAEECLRNIMGMVRPGGYLVVEGIDLDLKTDILKDSGFLPVLDRMDEIWRADTSKRGWPWFRWGLEPVDRNLPGWELRYSVIFRRSGP